MAERKSRNPGETPSEPCEACGSQFTAEEWTIVCFEWRGKHRPRLICNTQECRDIIEKKRRQAYGMEWVYERLEGRNGR